MEQDINGEVQVEYADDDDIVAPTGLHEEVKAGDDEDEHKMPGSFLENPYFIEQA